MVSAQLLLGKIREEFLQRGISNPQREAEDLLSLFLGCSRSSLYLVDHQLTENCSRSILSLAQRRGRREPLAYILGEQEFYGCSLRVTPDVLIPRQETELLVELVLKQCSRHSRKSGVLLDLCCGSGCVGIALKKHLPQMEVICSDLSLRACELTRENAKRNEVDIEVVQGDFLDPFLGGLRKVDVLVCNPPYIAHSEKEQLEKEVFCHEPHLALFAGEEGMEFYHRLAEGLPGVLRSGALVALECGRGQGEELECIFSQDFWVQVDRKTDWASHDRFFFLEFE